MIASAPPARSDAKAGARSVGRRMSAVCSSTPSDQPAGEEISVRDDRDRARRLLRRAGLPVEAAKSYARALALATNDSERRFLDRRLREVQRARSLTA